MEEQAQNLLATLKRSNVSAEQKLTAFNNLKSAIKHQRVPDASQPVLFECIRQGITTQTSPTLVSTAFSTLTHLIKRLSLQEQNNVIAQQTPRLLPILQERLGDQRESVRNAASQTLGDLWPFNKAEVERIVREGALGGNSARAKEVAMLWVVKLHTTDDLPFKSFVPSFVACLEDSDGNVRETAKSCVVELFRTAPDRAKTDLKKQMIAKDVRKTIQTFIIQHLGVSSANEGDLSASNVSMAASTSEHHGTQLNESIMSDNAASQEAPIEPLYVHTQRELEESFREMLPPFEGRETEHNWGPRDKSVKKLRRQLQGNAPQDFPVAFVAGIKSMQDSIIKVTNTLRTTMSTNGCQLVQELYKTLGTAMDPMTEIFIQNFIKMSAATKAISSKNSDACMEAILSHTTFNHRILHHIWLSFGEKNVQTKSLAPGWLKVIMEQNASHKSHMEHNDGVNVIEKCIKKGLEDAAPKVREQTRATYWAFAKIWPEPAATFLENLDNKTRTALEKDPNNPSRSGAAAASTTAAPRPRTVASKSSIRDAIVAQRRAALAKNMPDRPTSAASVLSTVDQTQSKSTKTGGPSDSAPQPSRPLISAPAKRPRRPEINRPATADPYASRRAPAKQTTPNLSPHNSPSKSQPVKSTATSRAIGRTPVRPAAQPTTSTVRSRSRLDEVHKSSPPHPSHIPLPHSSPSKDENMTLVVPFSQAPDDDMPVPSRLPMHRKSLSRDSGMHKLSEDDTGGFTMVLPTFRPEQGEKSSPGRPGSSGRPTSSGSISRVPVPKRSPIKMATDSLKHSSPMLQKVHTPSKLASPERPTPTFGQSVQVYEDPFQSPEPTSAAAPIKPVLEEIAINERPTSPSPNSALSQSTRSNEQNIDNHRFPSKAQSDADAARNRRLLTSAIERVRSKTLDAHGFRKVQELVKNGSSELWGDDGGKYSDLIAALLDYLNAPTESLPGNLTGAKAVNLKSQVLSTIRAMLAIHKREAVAWHAQALCVVIKAKRNVDDISHLGAEMERVITEVCRVANKLECLDAVLKLMDALSNPTSALRASSAPDGSSNAARSITLGLTTLSTLITPPPPVRSASPVKSSSRSPSKQAPPVQLDAAMTKRLGSAAVKLLEDPDPEVRRADLEYCLVLHERLEGDGEGRFWKAVAGAKEAGLNLITYYLARRGRA